MRILLMENYSISEASDNLKEGTADTGGKKQSSIYTILNTNILFNTI